MNDQFGEFDLDRPCCVAIPLRFDDRQPNVYGVEKAVSEACEYGEFVGDTRRGGSVNFERYSIIPHCNGTHTECVGHITDERISVQDCLTDVLIRAIVVSVTAAPRRDSPDHYPYAARDEDLFITRQMLEKSIEGFAQMNAFPSADLALVIRTLPNDSAKMTATYDDPVPAYLSNDAMKYIIELGTKHLLTDLPSIDRLYDNGELSNHRLFWNIPAAGKRTDEATRKNATVTELIFVPDMVPDGEYLLNLQIAPFVSDAVPSRPILFPKTKPAQIEI